MKKKRRPQRRKPAGESPRAPKNRAAPQPTIIFTGNRADDHFDVIVHGKVVTFTRASLTAMIALVTARGIGHGFACMSAVRARHVRVAIDQAVGEGAGMKLIENGGAEQYRLTIAAQDVPKCVVVGPYFSELVQLGIVSPAEAKRLVAAVSR